MFDELLPFFPEGNGSFIATSLPVPVACVGKIALPAVQVSMYPGAIAVINVLGYIMRGFPIAFPVVPEGEQVLRKVFRRPAVAEAA